MELAALLWSAGGVAVGLENAGDAVEMWDAGEDDGGLTAVAAEVLAALMGNAGEVDVGLENTGDAVEM